MIPPPVCRGDRTRRTYSSRRARGVWRELIATDSNRRGSRPQAGHRQVVG